MKMKFLEFGSNFGEILALLDDKKAKLSSQIIGRNDSSSTLNNLRFAKSVLCLEYQATVLIGRWLQYQSTIAYFAMDRLLV